MGWTDGWKAHTGTPSAQFYLSLMLDAAAKGLTTLERVVESTSTGPARIFQLRNKGRVEVGADADLVIVDLEAEKEITDAEVLSRIDWTPYAGVHVQGVPERTILRGTTVYRDGQVVGIPNSGDRLVGFQNGQLEGGLLIAPFDILALRDGYNLLGVYRDPWLETPLILNKNWAASHPAAAKGVTQALAEAAAWIYDPANRAEGIRILAEYTGIEADVVSDAYDFIVVDQKAISPDLTVPADSLRNILVIAQAVHGGEMAEFDLDKYYDGSYLEE